MKKICTIFLTATCWLSAHTQAILNEVYAIPGSARQEFFEFFNNTPAPVSMDNYTVVTYFETGGQKGFYVMDLPAVTISPRGYFVGSSSLPFNYQGVNNSTNSVFSWNDLAFLAAHNGYLRKWVLGTTVAAAIDGNAHYDLAPIPAGFNDFFNRIGGSGATYNVFVYQNGLLKNIFLGGTGGNAFLPTYITGLPSLFVDMAGSVPDFTINFSSYTNANPEYVTEDAGSDNGYIRARDGYCNSWKKSSSQVNHTPMTTNGGLSSTIPKEISVSAAITPGNAVSGSTVNYDVVAGPANEFPVTLYVYLDNGTVRGQLDANDTFLESKIETTVSDGAFSTTFHPYNANILVQAMTSAGCIDNIMFIPNTSVLPVKLVSFEAQRTEQGTAVKWTVAENESGHYFELEKSTDGRSFIKINGTGATHKAGTESYSLTDFHVSASAYYRIKIIDKTGKNTYSDISFVEGKATAGQSISLIANPVESYLTFQYAASAAGTAAIKIYNLSGATVLTQKISLTKGYNNITIATDGKFYAGAYILELVNNTENSRTKFIKR